MRSSNRERTVLFICRVLPWPLNGGAKIRNHIVLSALASQYTVDLISTADSSGPTCEELSFLCRKVFTFPKPFARFSSLFRLLESIRRGHSFFSSGQLPAEAYRAVVTLLNESPYDIIHIAELGSVSILPSKCRPAIVYDAHNCESALLSQRSKIEKFPFSCALAVEARRVRKAEASLLERSALVTAPSEIDLCELNAISSCVKMKGYVIPNGIDIHSYKSVFDSRPEDGTILVTGSMDWRPNRQGLVWFIEEVLPLVQDSVGPYPWRVVIAGRMSQYLVAALRQNPRLHIEPNPSSMVSILNVAQVVAVPVLVASGTRIRILEAWAAGRPVVTTTAGASGLPVIPAQTILISDCPRDFANSLVALLRDSTLRERVRREALIRVADYDRSRISSALLEAYQSLEKPAGVHE